MNRNFTHHAESKQKTKQNKKQSGTGNRHYRRQQFNGMSHPTFGLSCPLNYFTGQPPVSAAAAVFAEFTIPSNSNRSSVDIHSAERERERENGFENMKCTSEKNFKPKKKEDESNEKM